MLYKTSLLNERNNVRQKRKEKKRKEKKRKEKKRKEKK